MSALVVSHAPLRHGADAAMPAALAGMRTFHTLDALRGIAALAVVLLHAAFFFGVGKPAEGQIAVDLFFVMSGFIIAYRYDADLAAGMRLRDFILVRLIRLYPLYLLGAILGVLPSVMALASGLDDAFHRGMVESLPLHLLMIPSRLALPRIQELYPFNYVAWSLALEMLVNVAYAATFRVWTERRLVCLAAAAVGGLVACAVAYGGLQYGYAWPHWPCGLARILYGFPIGVLLYRLYARGRLAIRVPWWSALAVAVLVFWLPAPFAKPAWELFVIVAVVPLIVVAGIVDEPPAEARSVCAFAGALSYAVYSLHVGFIGLFIRAETVLHVDPASVTWATSMLFGVFLAALCLGAHVLYDVPVRRHLSRLTGRRTTRRRAPGLAIAVKN